MTKQIPYESEIQAKITAYLRRQGVFHFKAIMSSINGVPDIICCIDGRFIGIEVKRTDRSQISPVQFHVKQRIEDAGGESHIVWNLEQVKSIIQAHKKNGNRAPATKGNQTEQSESQNHTG